MAVDAKDSKVALKYDGEKPKHGLISSKFLDGLARVLTFGAKKYAAHNWRKGFDSSRLYDSIQRHLTAWNDGEDTDPESGLPHLAHAACGLMFLSEQMITRPDLDDRYKLKRTKCGAQECVVCDSGIEPSVDLLATQFEHEAATRFERETGARS